MERKRVVTVCPVCSGHLDVSEVTCRDCGARVLSRFDSCSVCRLPDEMYDFLMVFIGTRGSIKEMEKELGVSYPTVRSRMDELQKLMGFVPSVSTESRKEILDMLDRGEIKPEEAEEMLKATRS